MVYSFISYEKVCIHINYVTYVVQGLILGWLDRENIMQRIQKWHQLFYPLVKKLDNWHKLKVNISFGSSMARLFVVMNWSIITIIKWILLILNSGF